MFDGLPVEATALSPRTQWLLDNDYLILRSLRQAEDDMPPASYATLPTLTNGATRAEAVACAIVARVIVTWSGGRFDFVQMHRVVDGYRNVAPLTLGELWALPAFLRIVALEFLADAALDVTEAVRVETKHDKRVPATILALHALDKQDWTAVVESLSHIERRLREDPAGVYPRMEKETRDRYRTTLERLAGRSNRSEAEVAAEAVALARSAAATPDGHDERAHVGSYLFRPGVRELTRERRLNETEGNWMGWERKRGKPTELNGLITRGERESFVFRGDGTVALTGFAFMNAILCRGLLEGELGGAGLVNDVVVLERQPQHYRAHTLRLHCWIRGDWQLLPWSGRRAPGLMGGGPTPLSRASRWVLVQNVVRSLHPP